MKKQDINKAYVYRGDGTAGLNVGTWKKERKDIDGTRSHGIESEGFERGERLTRLGDAGWDSFLLSLLLLLLLFAVCIFTRVCCISRYPQGRTGVCINDQTKGQKIGGS